ncbi:hypothetical protein [Saccharospirillum mangrovi]|uniref:hypothetical protein n=1 Tax=Saccharospirillum mangrovi TaxID=2161747 RepID=UPI000D3729B8|nr:hypothetical protein [Saccharospirillum mangrovi]
MLQTLNLNRTQQYWLIGLAAALLLALSLWLVARYQARHVEAPEQLLTHLGEVAMGEASLDPAYLLVETLAQQQRLWLGEQLRADLTRSGHPDPDAAADALLPRASAQLDEPAGLALALMPRLQALPEPPWAMQERTSKRWQVQAGEHCLTLGFQGSKAAALWQWQDFSLCPVASD